MEFNRVQTWRLAAVALLLSCALSLCLSITAQAAEDSAADDASDEEITFTLSAAGDCTLGVDSRYNSNFNAYFRNHDAAYFLKKVKSVFQEDDVTLVNFEGTLTNATTRADKTFTFKGPAKYASILTEGSVEVVNLANNHSKDYGTRGFEDTKKTLKKYGIPFSYKSTIAYLRVQGVKVAFLGFTDLDGVTNARIKQGIDQAKKKGAAVVVVSFHWGIERQYHPNSRQKALGRYAIRCGASLVLGHHPHVLQGIEEYRGRYIVYSLGNFCFGGNSNPSDKDTMIFQQTFTVKNGKLQKTKDARIIPCSLSGKSYTNDFQPRVLSGGQKSSLIKKMNRLSRGMHVTVKSSGALK